MKIGYLCCVPYLDKDTVLQSMQVGIEDARSAGVLTQDVEVVARFVAGLPGGSAHDVALAWQELADEGVLGIVGPVNSDNCKAIRPTVDAGRVPTLPLGASYDIAGEWSFMVNFGAVPEESILCIRYLAAQGCRQIAAFSDSVWHGLEWLEFAEIAARQAGVALTFRARIPAETADPPGRLALAGAAVEGARAAGCDGVVALSSTSGVAYATAVNESGWDVPKAMTGGFTASRRRGLSPHFDGWVGTAMVDESNPLQQRFYDSLEQKLGTRDFEEQAALPVYDATRALLLGISLAPIQTPDGVRTGLEKIRQMPVAAGPAGSSLGFGPWDRSGYKGQHLVLRRYFGPERDDWRKVSI